jgi:two-component system, response regulator RegA
VIGMGDVGAVGSHESKGAVLFVDDDDVYRSGLVRAFKRRGFDTFEADCGARAVAIASHTPITYASIDLRMPTGSGLDVVTELKALRPEAVLVVLTGYGSIPTALEAMRRGATHYLTKPADADDLLAAFRRETREGSEPPPVIEHEVPSLARAEWEHINRVLDDCGGNVSKAARLLGIERKSLQRKLAKHPVRR